MNNYLSKVEKENLLRLSLLQAVLEIMVKGYEKAKSTDKEFLKDLRMAKTYCNKTIDYRLDSLNAEAEVDFRNSIGKLTMVFLPTNEAKKELANLKKLNEEAAKITAQANFDHVYDKEFPMQVDDMLDFMEITVPALCGKCQDKRFKTCRLRALLMKYKVPPVSIHNHKNCQYSYPAANIDIEAMMAKENIGSYFDRFMEGKK